jgi:hypothetical protein
MPAETSNHKIRETIITLIASFFLSLSLNTIIQYLEREKGTLIVHQPYAENQAIYMPIEITNYENTPLGDLRITIPRHIELSEIRSTSPITLQLATNEAIGRERTLLLSNIQPRWTTLILIPLNTNDDITSIRPQNYHDLGLELHFPEESEQPVKRAIWKAAQLAAVYAFFFGCFTWYYAGDSQRLRKQISELRIEQDKLNKKIDDLRSDADRNTQEATVSIKRHRLLLISHLRDHAAELSFWRDTIRRMLGTGPDAARTHDQIIKEVANGLKTYSTLSDYSENQIDTLRIIESLLEKREITEASANQISK